MRNIRPVYLLYLGLIVAGLAARVGALFVLGMCDMPTYMKWATDANARGLAQAYEGTYFPLQYQIFQGCGTIAAWCGPNYFIGFKVVNLVFDIAVFAMLACMLRRMKLHPAYALFYWCHPWFVSLFFLGYVDCQFGFFALLTAFLADKAKGFRGFCAAGIPLGIAFVMKPQAQVFVVVVVFYAVVRWLWWREWRTLGMLFGPVILFASYGAYFFLRGHSFLMLARSYLHLSDFFPCLTAQMLNVWYPVAHFLWPDERKSFSADSYRILGTLTCHHVAIALVLAWLLVFVYLVAREKRGKVFEHPWVLLFAYATVVFPMLITRAHENHLYLGTVFLVLLLPLAKRPVYIVAIHALLLLQFINIVSWYGLGNNPLSTYKIVSFLHDFHPLEVILIEAVLACVFFLKLLNFLFELQGGARTGFRRMIPGAVMLLMIAALYTLTFVTARLNAF